MEVRLTCPEHPIPAGVAPTQVVVFSYKADPRCPGFSSGKLFVVVTGSV